jgi:hypothetical protein
MKSERETAEDAKQGKARLGSIESCAGSDSLTDGSVGQFKPVGKF